MAKPSPSAVSNSIARSGARTVVEALPIEVMHNLQHQHNWTNLHLHAISFSSPSSSSSIIDIDTTTTTTTSSTPMTPNNGTDNAEQQETNKVFLVSGLPPRHAYTHPDLLNHLAAHDIDVDIDIDTDNVEDSNNNSSNSNNNHPVQREWVLPLNTSDDQTWTLGKFCGVFDALPPRTEIRVAQTGFRHRDVKRVVCAMKARDGRGGDGTIVYYIMQDGEVKPRQN